MSTTAPAPTALTRHVTACYRAATDAQRATGRDWYPTAHAIAADMATRHGVTVETAAGIIAALSPLNSWGANVRLADRLISEGGLTSGYLSVGLNKANAILKGTDPLTLLKSDKVRNFYLSIASAGVLGVTVDRHAYSIAVNSRTVNVPSLTPTRYAAIAETYRRAARILSKEFGPVTAAEVQAATWVSWRARYWSEGAFDL